MTTLEQSKALYEIFGEVETGYVYYADKLCILAGMDNGYQYVYDMERKSLVTTYHSELIPAYSTDTLLDLPIKKVVGFNSNTYRLKMDWSDDFGFTFYMTGKQGDLPGSHHWDKQPLTALVDLAIWLNKNGYLTTETVTKHS